MSTPASATAAVGAVYNVVHLGDKLVDPDDNTVLGYQGIYVGQARVARAGDPATVHLLDTHTRSAHRRLSCSNSRIGRAVQLHAARAREGRRGPNHLGVRRRSLIGQYQVVVLNRGARRGSSRATCCASIEPAERSATKARKHRCVWRESALAGRAGRHDDGVPHLRPDELCTRHGSHGRHQRARHRSQPVTVKSPSAPPAAQPWRSTRG